MGEDDNTIAKSVGQDNDSTVGQKLLNIRTTERERRGGYRRGAGALSLTTLPLAHLQALPTIDQRLQNRMYSAAI